MKALITGASGFVGSHVARCFISHGADVDVWVRREQSLPDVLRKHVKVRTVDLTANLEKLEFDSYDVIVHAAGANDIESQNPESALWSTAWTTRNLLRWCLLHGIQRLLYFSTFQVYGRWVGDVSDATDVRCSSDYALTHFFAEQYLRMYERLGHIRAVVVRPTNIYGAPLGRDFNRWTLVPLCFCKEAMEKGTITLRTSGRQHRDFVSATDVAELVYLLCVRFNQFAGRTFNLASGKSRSIRSVAEQAARIFEEECGRRCEVRSLSQEPLEEHPLVIDISALAELKHPLMDSMEQTMREVYRFLRG